MDFMHILTGLLIAIAMTCSEGANVHFGHRTYTVQACFKLPFQAGRFNSSATPETLKVDLSCKNVRLYPEIVILNYTVPTQWEEFCGDWVDCCARGNTQQSCYRYIVGEPRWAQHCVSTSNGSCQVSVPRLDMSSCPYSGFTCTDHSCWSRWIEVQYVCKEPPSETTTAPILHTTTTTKPSTPTHNPSTTPHTHRKHSNTQHKRRKKTTTPATPTATTTPVTQPSPTPHIQIIYIHDITTPTIVPQHNKPQPETDNKHPSKNDNKPPTNNDNEPAPENDNESPPKHENRPPSKTSTLQKSTLSTSTPPITTTTSAKKSVTISTPKQTAPKTSPKNKSTSKATDKSHVNNVVNTEPFNPPDRPYVIPNTQNTPKVEPKVKPFPAPKPSPSSKSKPDTPKWKLSPKIAFPGRPTRQPDSAGYSIDGTTSSEQPELTPKSAGIALGQFTVTTVVIMTLSVIIITLVTLLLTSMCYIVRGERRRQQHKQYAMDTLTHRDSSHEYVPMTKDESMYQQIKEPSETDPMLPTSHHVICALCDPRLGSTKCSSQCEMESDADSMLRSISTSSRKSGSTKCSSQCETESDADSMLRSISTSSRKSGETDSTVHVGSSMRRVPATSTPSSGSLNTLQRAHYDHRLGITLGETNGETHTYRCKHCSRPVTKLGDNCIYCDRITKTITVIGSGGTLRNARCAHCDLPIKLGGPCMYCDYPNSTSSPKHGAKCRNCVRPLSKPGAPCVYCDTLTDSNGIEQKYQNIRPDGGFYEDTSSDDSKMYEQLDRNAAMMANIVRGAKQPYV